MEANFTEEQRYILAKKKVEKISKFYKHLAVYIVVNTFLSAIFIVGDINDGDTFKEAFFNLGNYKIWFFWGIGVVFQALNVFGLNIIFNKDWEKRNIEKYMNE
ncbi:2TM domain-containing protein [Polaribacter sargassicola]|uniref:2TM domain-containing protein n=1 Tax=Polaribacter sargassicola TaxID=2836891 RepID=UPI001F1E265A|nr:2TM domain-containing protein [Polaribacter sp. DS7-9]MCG1036683.1 2TM domain-containing protein [Polaribacter sp. DS7-9]